jgi:hypothetical protein
MPVRIDEDAMKRLIEICDPAPSIAYITEA